MPSAITESPWKTLTVKECHLTFGAEVEGVDFQNLSDEQLKEVEDVVTHYGFCVFRNTGLDDNTHIEFSRRLGDLDDIRRYLKGGRKPRYNTIYLFDAGNIDDNGGLLDPDSPRAHAGRGNKLFHTDSSFNPRRASYSLLRGVIIPPKSAGGTTDFADSRTAFEELPDDLKVQLLENDYVGCHTFAHSRKNGSPEFFKDLDPSTFPMARHKLVQKHEPSGRMNLYCGAHLHHIEGLPENESAKLIKKLNDWVTQDKYTFSVHWDGPGDLVIWDNRATLHRAGPFYGQHLRDLRRTTVHDDSPTAWGLNPVGQDMPGFDSTVRPTAP